MKIEIIGLPKIHHRYVIGWVGENTGKIYYWSSYESKSLADYEIKDLHRARPITIFVIIDTKEE